MASARAAWDLRPSLAPQRLGQQSTRAVDDLATFKQEMSRVRGELAQGDQELREQARKSAARARELEARCAELERQWADADAEAKVLRGMVQGLKNQAKFRRNRDGSARASAEQGSPSMGGWEAGAGGPAGRYGPSKKGQAMFPEVRGLRAWESRARVAVGCVVWRCATVGPCLCALQIRGANGGAAGPRGAGRADDGPLPLIGGRGDRRGVRGSVEGAYVDEEMEGMDGMDEHGGAGAEEVSDGESAAHAPLRESTDAYA